MESVFGLAFSILYIAWWLTLPRYGHLIFGPIAGFFSLNPDLRSWYLPVLVPVCIVMLQQCVNLIRPQWLWLRAAALLLSDSFSLFIFISISKVRPCLIAVGKASLDARHTRALAMLNQVLSWSILCVIIGICIGLVVHAYQTLRELRRMSKGSGNGSSRLPASQTL